MHFYGTVINGLTFDSNTLSGQTFTGAQPEQTCCSGTCYFNSSFSNVARSLFSLNGGPSGPVVSNLTFTNNLITGTAGAGANGNILVQMTASSALVQRNAFLGSTVTGPGALNSCNRGALRVRGTNFTVTCNQFSASGLSGNGAYYIQSDQTSTSNPFAGEQPLSIRLWAWPSRICTIPIWPRIIIGKYVCSFSGLSEFSLYERSQWGFLRRRWWYRPIDGWHLR